MSKAPLLFAAFVVVPTLSLAQTWNLIVFDPREGRPGPRPWSSRRRTAWRRCRRCAPA